MVGNANGESTLSRDGVEVVSPILQSNDILIPNKIQKVCGRLNGLGQKITDKCGGHIHIGADYLQSEQAYINLVELVCNTEKILYLITNKPGEIPSYSRIKYITPISGSISETIKRKNENIKQFLKNSQGFGRKDINLNEKRYYGINFLNLGESKNTIEFRMPNGTLDPNIWIENINLFGGIVKTAQEIAIIQGKKNKTKKDKLILEIFKKIKTKDINEEDKLLTLLRLCILRKDKSGYINKYIANSQLLKTNIKVNEYIDKYVTKEPINFSYTKEIER